MEKSSRRCGNQGFSLVEILTVLAVVSILALLAMPTVSPLRSTSLSVSGNQMVDVFAMARQNSISKNVFTAVVIKTQGTGACASYSLLQLARKDDGTFGNWTTVVPWKYLPKGIIFEKDQSIDTFMGASAPLPLALPNSYPFQGSQIDLSGSGVVVQCYQADGTLIQQNASSGQSVRLRLIEGAADASGAVTYQGKTVSGTQVSYYDLFFIANTGNTKIGRS